MSGVPAPSRPRTIVCFGDSLMTCGGEGGLVSDHLARMVPECRVINRGVSSDTLEGGRHRFQSDVLDLKPDLLVFELGANDWRWAARPAEELRKDLFAMIASAREAGAAVVIASCFGNTPYQRGQSKDFKGEPKDLAEAIWRNEVEAADRFGCELVSDMQADIRPNGRAPYWDDDNHPNSAGNALVAKRIFEAIRQFDNRSCR